MESVIVEIRPGVGGEDARLFAGDLLRMYERVAMRKGWRVQVLSESPTRSGGIREGIIQVSGKNVNSAFRSESGVHRVQRVPPTESKGRRQTSTVTVACLPVPSQTEVAISSKDVREDTYRSSGAGGQHVNKTSSAIRLTHIPTGIVVTCQDDRSQHRNRESAMTVLRARLYAAKQEQLVTSRVQERRNQIGRGARVEHIRTYNFMQDRLTDHRTGQTVHGLRMVLAGSSNIVCEG